MKIIGERGLPITENQSQSLLLKSRSTECDAEVLRKIANQELTEAEAQSHLIRLMLQCADLRRRLEGSA